MPSTSSRSTIRRSRLLYAGLVVATIGLGLASRRFADSLPFSNAARLYLGDVLWAAMVYFLASTVWQTTSVRRLAMGAIAFSALIETSQLYHAPWIDAVRATRLGALVLGYGFLWSDIVCYVIGVAAAALVDRVLIRRVGARSLREERGSGIVS